MSGHMPHGDDHGDPSKAKIGKFVGITMAVLGVLLALSGALVGGARTELVATMVEQTNASLQFQATASKHRTLFAQLQQLHAIMPSDPVAFKKQQDDIKAYAERNKKSPSLPVLQQVATESDMIINAVVPTGSDVLRFIELVKKFELQKDAAKEWTESYEASVTTYQMAAEHFEWAQLAAEIGIVIASIGLLLSSKPAWFTSIGLGAASLGIILVTYSAEHSALTAAKAKIDDAHGHFVKLTDERADQAADEALLVDLKRALGEPTEATAHESGHH